jgi:hypothetical protein
MSARVRGVPLICAALLGALLVSCGGPPVYVVAPPAPAAAPAPAPQGGLQGRIEEAPPPPVEATPPVQGPPPAPVVVPAPAAPAPAPLAPATRPPVPVSGRPGGASSLVEFSDATAEGALKTWKKEQSQNCAKAGYHSLESGCVHLKPRYVDQDGNVIQGEHKNCDNGTANRPVSAGDVNGKTYINAGTTVTVEYKCEPSDVKPKEQKSQTEGGRKGK